MIDQASSQAAMETRATLITSQTPSAVAVVLVQGARAREFVESLWHPNRPDLPLRTNAIRYGQWVSIRDDTAEGVVVCMTAEDTIEVHSHGGPVASQRILEDLQQLGAKIELSESAANALALPKDLSLIQQEAWYDLIQVNTSIAAEILLDQYSGCLDNAFQSIQHLMAIEDITNARQAINELLHFEQLGLHLLEPRTILLCGPPNSGKSSLMNSLLGFQRVIVHDSPGTTRDLIIENSAVMGLPVRFVDSAGIRETDNSIENAGIEAAKRAMLEADLALVLIDLTTGWTMQHEEIVKHLRQPYWLVGTKADTLPEQASHQELRYKLAIDCRTPTTIAPLLRELEQFLLPPLWKPGQAVPFRPRHIQWLRQCFESISSR